MTATDTDILDLCRELRRINGSPLRATTKPSGELMDAARTLAIYCGAPADIAVNLRWHELLGFYSTATSINGPDAARKFAARFIPAPSAAPIPAQAPRAAPRAAPTAQFDDSDLWAAIYAHKETIKALESELAAIAETRPKPVTITVADLPPVTFQISHPALPRLLKKAANRKAAWLVGPRGSGKSKAARQVAEALGLECYVLTGADDGSDIIGYIQPHDGSIKITPFRRAWTDGGIVLFDEMDTYNPAALTVINDAIASRECSFPDGMIPQHPDCVIIAGTNTDGRGATVAYSARSVLDAATRDRFAYIPWPYCSVMEQALGAANPHWTRYVQAVRAAMEAMSMDETPSPRATIEGATDLAQGDTWAEVIESRIFKGLSPDYIRRINERVKLSDYMPDTAQNERAA